MRRFLIVPLAFSLVACGPADTDEDLLTDEFEAIIGTDPEVADTDGDGFDDGYEHFTFFNPRSTSDHPYEFEDGSDGDFDWDEGTADYVRLPLPTGDAWDDLSEDAGWNEGKFSKSWNGTDQVELDLKLRRFYGQVILIDLSTEWCPPCQAAAETLEEEYRDRLDDGFIAFTILMEGRVGGEEPIAQRWADDFGLTLPVIADEPGDVSRRYFGGAWPSYTIINREHEIVSLDQQGGEADFELIDELLDEEPPDVEYDWPEDAGEIAEALGVPIPTL